LPASGPVIARAPAWNAAGTLSQAERAIARDIGLFKAALARLPNFVARCPRRNEKLSS
jgi:hypothetical protein